MGKPSLFGDERRCYVCSSPYVEKHHIYPSARRQRSEDEGCTVYLCREHHQGMTGAHRDRAFDLELKRECQRRWEEREGKTHDDFRKLFFESYL